MESALRQQAALHHVHRISTVVLVLLVALVAHRRLLLSVAALTYQLAAVSPEWPASSPFWQHQNEAKPEPRLVLIKSSGRLIDDSAEEGLLCFVATLQLLMMAV